MVPRSLWQWHGTKRLIEFARCRGQTPALNISLYFLFPFNPALIYYNFSHRSAPIGQLASPTVYH